MRDGLNRERPTTSGADSSIRSIRRSCVPAPTITPIPHRRRYVSIADAAEYLGVTDRTIRQMIVDGRLTGYRNGAKLIRLDLNEIDAAMEPFGGGVS